MNIDSSGNVYYLDRHRVACRTGYALNYFQLVRAGNNENIKYAYKCCPVQFPCAVTDRTNSYTSVNSQDPVYLDRQNVNCIPVSNSFLSSFTLDRKGLASDSDVRYKYGCCKLKGGKTHICDVHTTGFKDDGGGNSRYLDRYMVQCPYKYALAQFQLKRNSDHTKWRYDYTCCKAYLS